MLSVLRRESVRSLVRGKNQLQVLAVANRSTAVVAEDDSALQERVSAFRKEQGWATPLSKQERIAQWDYVNSVYFGSERDMKNFPTPTVPDYAEPTRLGVFPAKLFDFFYPATGVSGPYVFLSLGLVFCMSKEYLVWGHHFSQGPIWWTWMYIFTKHPAVGPKIRDWYAKNMEASEEADWYKPMRVFRENEKKDMDALERLLEETESIDYINQSKVEGVALQLEAAYRERLQKAYTDVKKRLDYECDKSSAKKQFEQEHMVNWIVENVKKNITPQQEKESIASCLATLKQLAAKQPATA